MTDYQDMDEFKPHIKTFKQIIIQNGGELEDSYCPRLTHVLCRTQDSFVSQQGAREGKRLITVHWLNDIVVRKKVLAPWKAIHFPLPSK